MSFVYILSTYGEYGAEAVVATLDRSRVAGIVRNWVTVTPYPEKLVLWRAEAVERVNQALAETDEDLARRNPINLHDGGGMQLHVTRLV